MNISRFYQDNHPNLTEMKAAQMGINSKAMSKWLTGRDTGATDSLPLPLKVGRD
jgi:hypothetical protein